MVKMAQLGGFILENGRPKLGIEDEKATREDIFKDTVMCKIPIELYGHILPVFGTKMTKDKYIQGKVEDKQELREARQKIWEIFRDKKDPKNPVEYHIQFSIPFIFADFGTTEQFYEHLVSYDDMHRVYQFRGWLNHFVDMGVGVSEEAKIYDSIILGTEGSIQPGVIVIFSKLDKGFDIGRGSIVYGVQDSQGNLKLKRNSMLYQLPVTVKVDENKEPVVSVLCGSEDDPKKLLYGEYVDYTKPDKKGNGKNKKGNRFRYGSSNTRATFFGCDFLEWIAEKGINPDDIWGKDNNDKPIKDEDRSLWNARLYVVGDKDFHLTLWMQEEGTPDQ